MLHTQSSEIKLLFAGDIMQHGPQIRAAQIGKDQFDYTNCFKYIAPTLQSADLVIGNLELTLTKVPPYSGYPLFVSPDTLADALKNAGFDILMTANNHANDGHIKGLVHTIDKLDQVKILQTGTFRNAAERDLHYPLIVYKNGFKIAFLNYTYDTNGIPTRSPTVVNLIDHQQIKKDIITARRLQADIIITFMHWGYEYQTEPHSKQTSLAKNMLRWGADLVIGAHPHVAQPIESYTLKRANGDIEKTLVAYSLGNFISNQQQTNTDGGLLLEVTFTKNDATKKTQLEKANYLPIWRYIGKEKHKNQYYTLSIKDFEKLNYKKDFLSTKAWKQMKNYARKLRFLLKDTPVLERKD
ncbi:MAG: CapA family protein [Saprospiraceae bacterium]